MSKAVLITGATGNQGGAVIEALIKENADFEILALTRQASSSGAQNLLNKSPNIKLVEGNMDDPSSIFRNAQRVASQPIWGVFSVPVLAPGRSKHDAEELQGKALIDEAINNNVKYFVYTSVDRGGDASYETPTDIPHFITKHNIEHHLVEKTKNGAMDWAVLRPACFFENFTPDFLGKVVNSCWKVALKSIPLQLVAVSDIGFFGAQAFLKPDEYKRKFISLAGDEITFAEMARTFKARTGKDIPLTYGFISRLLMWMVKDVGHMYRWFYESGYRADIPSLRKIHPGLKDFGAWLETDSGFTTK